MERVPFHDCEMEISIQYHVMLIRQSSDQIVMRCYIMNFVYYFGNTFIVSINYASFSDLEVLKCFDFFLKYFWLCYVDLKTFLLPVMKLNGT